MKHRAINVGDAIHDFDHLKLYEAKAGRDTVKKLVTSVLSEATTRPADPLPSLELRRQIADVLEK